MLVLSPERLAPRIRSVLLSSLALFSAVANAADYKAESLKEPAPSDEFAEAIADQLSPAGVRVLRDDNRPLCDIWFLKSWASKDGFKPSLQVQFPFQSGQLMGVIRYHRRGEDYRGQQIPKGLYTVRFALQPVDGNHVGTSDTRDFFVLVSPDTDESPKPMAEDDLFIVSGEAIESSHPAMLQLRTVNDEGDLPRASHDDAFDLWMAACQGKVKAGGNEKDLALNVVVVGHAEHQ